MGVPNLHRAVVLGVQQPAEHGRGQRLARVRHAVLTGIGQVGTDEVDSSRSVEAAYGVGQQQQCHDVVGALQVSFDAGLSLPRCNDIGTGRVLNADLHLAAGKSEQLERNISVVDGEGA